MYLYWSRSSTIYETGERTRWPVPFPGVMKTVTHTDCTVHVKSKKLYGSTATTHESAYPSPYSASGQVSGTGIRFFPLPFPQTRRQIAVAEIDTALQFTRHNFSTTVRSSMGWPGRSPGSVACACGGQGGPMAGPNEAGGSGGSKVSDFRFQRRFRFRGCSVLEFGPVPTPPTPLTLEVEPCFKVLRFRGFPPAIKVVLLQTVIRFQVPVPSPSVEP